MSMTENKVANLSSAKAGAQPIITAAQIFDGFECTFMGDANRTVIGITYKSQDVRPGEAFCCIVGLKSDGHAFAQDAVNRGASVLICQRVPELTNAEDVTCVLVEDSRKAMAWASAQFYHNPSNAFSLVGVTGTNGKTTTAFLVNHIARCMDNKTGLIGTVGIMVDGNMLPAEHTTPESCNLQETFSQMRAAGCSVVTMEVSSHALALDRTWASNFAITAFTNLTQDHLDYHKTFEAYFEAKRTLFSSEYPARRVINIDSDWGQALLAYVLRAGDSVITTGMTPPADIHPIKIAYEPTRTRMVLSIQGELFEVEYPLVGKFNVENVMTAFGIALQLGYDIRKIIHALESVPAVPGRIERVVVEEAEAEAGNAGLLAREIMVYVDYAHTPDAIEKALASVKELTQGRTIVVFGCGGDRDATKRPIMGAAALEADFAVVTSDNPRTENPDAIIEDILAGMAGQEERYLVEPDRRSAIRAALQMARPGDAVVIAGKGHEDYQIVGTEKHHFSDAEVAREELLALG